MKNYKYKFSRLTAVLLIVGIVLAVACIVLNAIRFIGVIKSNTALSIYDIASLILAVGLALAFIVFAIFALVSSYYEITEKGVIFKCGLIKTKIDASEVKEIKFEYLKNRLELIFLDESYFVILISESQYENFIDEFRLKFTKIPYIQISEPNK